MTRVRWFLAPLILASATLELAAHWLLGRFTLRDEGKAMEEVRAIQAAREESADKRKELVEQVKELEHRRDAEEAERQIKVLLQAGAVQRESRERASKKEAAHEEGMHTGRGHGSKRRNLMPEFMIMYEYKRDTLGRPHIEPIAAMKLPWVWSLLRVSLVIRA